MGGGGEKGIALVLVLWMVTLLAVIAGNFAFAIRTDTRLSQNQLALAQARALADGGVQRAVYELFKPPTDLQRWEADGAVHEFVLNGSRVRVAMLDESGKIDLNTASDALVKGLLLSTGLSEEDSAALLDAILDWKDADDLRRPNGAEADDYRRLGLNYTPSNAPFETVEELRRVRGVSRELYARLAPFLTVYSKQPGINAAIAPREVLLAIPGVTPQQVDEYLVQRQQQLAAGQKAAPFQPAAPYAAQSGGGAYSVRAEATLPDGVGYVREAVVKLTHDGKRPVIFLAWGEGRPVQKTEQEKKIDGNKPN